MSWPFHFHLHLLSLELGSCHPLQDREKLGDIDLTSGFSVVEVTEKAKLEHMFEIGTDGGTFLLAADSRKEMKEWLEVLGKHATRNSSSQAANDDKSDEEDSALLNVDMQQILAVSSDSPHSAAL